MSVSNDPLSQTHSPASSDHYCHFKFVLFYKILKSGDKRTDVHPPLVKKVITIGYRDQSKQTLKLTLLQSTLYQSAQSDFSRSPIGRTQSRLVSK